MLCDYWNLLDFQMRCGTLHRDSCDVVLCVLLVTHLYLWPLPNVYMQTCVVFLGGCQVLFCCWRFHYRIYNVLDGCFVVTFQMRLKILDNISLVITNFTFLRLWDCLYGVDRRDCCGMRNSEERTMDHHWQRVKPLPQFDRLDYIARVQRIFFCKASFLILMHAKCSKLLHLPQTPTAALFWGFVPQKLHVLAVHLASRLLLSSKTSQTELDFVVFCWSSFIKSNFLISKWKVLSNLIF